MAKVKALVTGAVVDGKKTGEEVTLDENDAKHLEKIGYVKIVGKAESKPKGTKKPAAKKTSTKDSK